MAASLPLPTSIHDGAEVPDDKDQVVEMKYLFGKVLMPSDVSWVTEQLVIPNNHVGKLRVVDKDQEGFFVVVVEDGAVSGKIWRFRYLNRNNVDHCLTKGWGCFVREKGLRPGDTVSFFRGGNARERLFIFCNRGTTTTTSHHCLPPPARDLPSSGHGEVGGSTPAARPPPPLVSPRRRRRGTVHPEGEEPTTEMPMILESMTLVGAPPLAKRVRLFGVYINVPPQQPSGGEPERKYNP
uniref:TF-B3 domain-containing protein n=1 Tax=Leersia perrieri TaxID=77586 RepID=A0A0D9VFN8_9ORYZ